MADYTDYNPLKNDLILRAARKEPTERTPVWMMRQAGRYLPEYRALRAEENFFEICRNPELAVEVTLQPVKRYPLDAAILFSDILVVPQALGYEIKMVPGEGPKFTAPLRNPGDVARLRKPDVKESLGYVFDAIRLARKALGTRLPLIGFAGAPWTLMVYMIEGGGSKNFALSRAWLYQHPSESHQLLQLLTDVVGDYLEAQIAAGAHLVQVFDTWAGLLSPSTFRQFGAPYLKQIGERLKGAYPETPRIVFAKGAHYALDTLAGSSYDVISLDWTIDPRHARRVIDERTALQGNLDPSILYAEPRIIREEVRRMLMAFGQQGHIANLGHGLHPDHDPEKVRIFIEAVQEISRELRG